MPIRSHALSLLLYCSVAAAPFVAGSKCLLAQTTPANTTQRGTVKSVTATAIVIATDANAELTVTPTDSARILQLAPGSTDLKSAQTIPLSDIAAGDRVLVTGRPGDAASTVTAARIILMKSSDIASLHASQTQDWQRHGTGGVVKSVSGNTITVGTGAKLLTVTTAPTTIYRRYASDSVKFEDAKAGSLAEIAPGDQLRVRGAKSDDGGTITADEIVSGAFQNLAGAVGKVDPSAGTITLKDLATKQTVTVSITSNSDLRHLPEQQAAAFARSHSDAATPSGPSAPSTPGASSRRAGMDLSQMLSRLPSQQVADLKPGDAVMIVASRTSTGSLTAVTLLSGVEPILSTSAGQSTPTLSPWTINTGGAEAGGGGQ